MQEVIYIIGIAQLNLEKTIFKPKKRNYISQYI